MLPFFLRSWEYCVRNECRRPTQYALAQHTLSAPRRCALLLNPLGLLLMPIGVAWVASVSVLLVPDLAGAQDTAEYFRQNCMNCHTIGGGRLTGPDLKNLSQRQEREWLVNFLVDPRGVITSGDPYAQQLLEEFRNVPMPNMPGMKRALAESLLDLIKAESKLDTSQFQGRQTADRPFTDEDRLQGNKLFIGQWRLFNGGTPCIACHSAPALPTSPQRRAPTTSTAMSRLRPVGELPFLGGGQLGPSMTSAYERLGGSKLLRDWLASDLIESPHPVFKSHPLEADEVHALAAYIEGTASEQPSSPTIGRMTFLLLGLVSSTALVFLSAGIRKLQRWQARRRRLRSPQEKQ